MRPGCMLVALICGGGPARRAGGGQGGSRHETSSHGAETRRMTGPMLFVAMFALATPPASGTATSVCGCVAACSRAYGAMWLQMRNHRQTVTNARPMMSPDQIGPTAARPPPPWSGRGVRRPQAPSAGPVIVSIPADRMSRRARAGRSSFHSAGQRAEKIRRDPANRAARSAEYYEGHMAVLQIAIQVL